MMAFGHMRHKRIVFVGDTCIHNHTQPHLQQNMHIIHTPCWQLRSFMCVKVWLLGYKSTCPKQNYYLVKSFKLPCKTLPWGKIIHFGHKFPRISWKFSSMHFRQKMKDLAVFHQQAKEFPWYRAISLRHHSHTLRP